MTKQNTPTAAVAITKPQPLGFVAAVASKQGLQWALSTLGYTRVSSLDQNVDRQLDGISVDKAFTDSASGKDVQRPQLAAMVNFVRDGDTVIVHSMDRLARNLDDLRSTVRN